VLSLAASLDDRDLLRRLQELAGQERSATSELVAHLAELDARKLYLGEGYASLFGYCTDALRLAEHAAYKRIVAARACRTFPPLLDHLADGSLNLSTLRLLAPHLTAENFDGVLAHAKGRSKREVEELVARLAPQPEPVPSVRKLPVRGGAGKLLLEETARTKLAAVRKPRANGHGGDSRSRHLPAQIIRAVWKRDGGRCAFVGRKGNRCQERTFLEFHHVEAFGLGGKTEANLSLRCRSHNQYEARLVFGAGSN